jgi:hypothetical protein
MSLNSGSTLISATIRPNDSNDIIATVLSNEAKGGHHSVATVVMRDAIFIQRKELGMLCTVHSDPGYNGVYQLSALPNTWSLFKGEVGTDRDSWLNAVIDEVSTLPNTPNVGDRYLASINVSGNLIGNANKIAEYTIIGWVYTIPFDGDMVVMKSRLSTVCRYSGDIWVKLVVGGLSVKNHLINEVIEVPENYQYFVYGNLIIEDAHLINYGQVVVLNGDVVILGTGKLSNFGDLILPKLE